MTTEERPDVCTDEILEYLDELHKSGAVYMFGATPYIQKEFFLERSDARDVLLYWINTFSERRPE